MKSIFVLTFFSILTMSFANAGEAPKMMEACKAECPDAKSEDEADKCMMGVAKKKKGDKAFAKSECFLAMKEHEKHEKAHGHKH